MSEPVLYGILCALASTIVVMAGAFLAMLRREQAATDAAVLLLAAVKAEDAKALAKCNAERVDEMRASVESVRAKWMAVVAEMRLDREADRELRHKLADAVATLAAKYEVAQLNQKAPKA